MSFDRRRVLAIAAVAAVVGGGGFAYRTWTNARPGAINTLDSADGAAIKGYDPVAYFVDGKPRRGEAALSAQHGGATWRFASAENRAAFLKHPQKYVPAYGGYCAFGVAQGYLVKIEPDAWVIRDGRLYLNYDANVQQQWSKDPAGFIATASKKWPELAGAP